MTVVVGSWGRDGRELGPSWRGAGAIVAGSWGHGSQELCGEAAGCGAEQLA